MNPIRNILVCVTQQKTCERLIREAITLKGENEGELHVIHVAKNEWKFLDNAKEGEALEYLFKVSKSIGAKLSVLKSDDIVNSIVNYINDNEINCVVLGKSKEAHKENKFIKMLENNVKDVDICIVS
ncbi:MAG: universal stress protein [Bacillota bacterium]|nr:universal stress protein [Bacillota bacterium]